jgi:DNA-binding NarL/FixJ family response regulator
MTVRSVVISSSRPLLDAIVHAVGDDDRLDLVGLGRTAADGLRLVSIHSPDVVAIDQSVGHDHGVEVAESVIAASGGTARVVLSIDALSDSLLVRAFSVGIGAVVLQPDGLDWMVQAMKVLAGGGSLMSPGVSRWAIGRVLRDVTPAPAVPALPVPLTHRERHILRLVGLGRSNRQIADELFVSEATVKTHVLHLFSKLGVSDRANAVVAAFRSGLVVPADR